MACFWELNENFEQGGDIYGSGDVFSQPDALSAGSAMGVFNHGVSNVEESTGQDGFYAGGTAFQFRKRQSHLPSDTYNWMSQGTAPRGVRLQKRREEIQPAIVEEARFMFLIKFSLLEIER